MLRLLEFGADVTAAVYPVKQIDWDKMAAAVQAGRSPLESATLSYVVEREAGERWSFASGFVKSRYAGTGFLLIRRSVLEAMIERLSGVALQARARGWRSTGRQSLALRAFQLHGRSSDRLLPE